MPAKAHNRDKLKHWSKTMPANAGEKQEEQGQSAKTHEPHPVGNFHHPHNKGTKKTFNKSAIHSAMKNVT